MVHTYIDDRVLACRIMESGRGNYRFIIQRKKAKGFSLPKAVITSVYYTNVPLCSHHADILYQVATELVFLIDVHDLQGSETFIYHELNSIYVGLLQRVFFDVGRSAVHTFPICGSRDSLETRFRAHLNKQALQPRASRTLHDGVDAVLSSLYNVDWYGGFYSPGEQQEDG